MKNKNKIVLKHFIAKPVSCFILGKEKRHRFLDEHDEKYVKRKSGLKRLDSSHLSKTVIDAFDEDFYCSLYPDIRLHKVNPFEHYVELGSKEGRLSSVTDVLESILYTKNNNNFDANKKTIAIVVHEASKTGCPLLTLDEAKLLKNSYNLVMISLARGDLFDKYSELSYISICGKWTYRHDSRILKIIFENKLKDIDIDFALVNSVSSHAALKPLSLMGIPLVCCMHEFYHNSNPVFVKDLLVWSDISVFSSKLTQDSVQYKHNLHLENSRIIPQGTLKHLETVEPNDTDAAVLKQILFFKNDGFKIVISAGFADHRKGADMFLEFAYKLKQKTKEKVKFFWLGDMYNDHFKESLDSMFSRYDLRNDLFFTGYVSDVASVYKMSELFVLTSRLDPLPSVVMEAMAFDVPFVCFDKSSGYPELLEEYGISSLCVAPDYDVNCLASLSDALITDKSARENVIIKLRQMFYEKFNMNSYIDALIKAGHEAKQYAKSIAENVKELSDKTLSYNYFRSDKTQELFREFRATSVGFVERKIAPGVYSTYNTDSMEQRQNVFKEYFVKGKLNYEAVEIKKDFDSKSVAVKRKAALHIHVFYTDVLEDILIRLQKNSIIPDLFISTREDLVESINEILGKYSLTAVVKTVGNLGRDLYPLFSVFKDDFAKYEYIGHVHTKKSPHANADLVREWYEMCISNCVGNEEYQAIPQVLKLFEDNDKLGLVFPDDINVCGWDLNREYALDLLKDIKVNTQIRDSIIFPIGSFFWFRYSALDNLWKYLDNVKIPMEPLPIDGSVLHALERVIPLISQANGYSFATTYINGLSRRLQD